MDFPYFAGKKKLKNFLIPGERNVRDLSKERKKEGKKTERW